MTRTVIAVVDDMLFASKIRETGKSLGLVVMFPRTLEAFRSSVREEMPQLIVVDLHNQKVNAFELATELKSQLGLKRIPLWGFFSHVQVELQRQALEAGYDQVIPRSVFARDMAELLTGKNREQT